MKQIIAVILFCLFSYSVGGIRYYLEGYIEGYDEAKETYSEMVDIYRELYLEYFNECIKHPCYEPDSI